MFIVMFMHKKLLIIAIITTKKSLFWGTFLNLAEKVGFEPILKPDIWPFIACRAQFRAQYFAVFC